MCAQYIYIVHSSFIFSLSSSSGVHRTLTIRAFDVPCLLFHSLFLLFCPSPVHLHISVSQAVMAFPLPLTAPPTSSMPMLQLYATNTTRVAGTPALPCLSLGIISSCPSIASAYTSEASRGPVFTALHQDP
jgi:hypothetical protein